MLNDKEKLEKHLSFVMTLIGLIPKQKLNDEYFSIINVKTNEDFGTLKEYIEKNFKDLYGADINWKA